MDGLMKLTNVFRKLILLMTFSP